MTAAEVVRISTRLDSIIQEDNLTSTEIIDLLKKLEKLPIDLDVLQQTSIGKSVNNLRKGNVTDQVASVCKSLVKSWKGLLKDTSSGEKASASPQSTGEPATKRAKIEVATSHSSSGVEAKKSNGALSRSVSTTSNGSSASNSPSDAIKTTTASTPPLPKKATDKKDSAKSTNGNDSTTNDGVRLKTRELVVKALTKEESPEGSLDPAKVAAEIEECIFQEFGRKTDTRYKNKMRSRIINLQDSRNPRLRENVLLGHISPSRFASMSSDEMASEEMKSLREKYTKEAIDDHQMATSSGTETDLLQCGKCKQRKCTYNQVQTRSADEPMTTFVYCNVCGNLWKFC